MIGHKDFISHNYIETMIKSLINIIEHGGYDYKTVAIMHHMLDGLIKAKDNKNRIKLLLNGEINEEEFVNNYLEFLEPTFR